MMSGKEKIYFLLNRIDDAKTIAPSGRITQEKYDSLLAKYKQVQADILLQMEQHSKADENYYVEASRLLELASRAYELFESSEPIEKRQLLRFALQNFQLDGTLVRYNEIKPFDKIREYASRQAWLLG